MRPFIYLTLLLACGCAGPGTALTDQKTATRQGYCPTSQKTVEPDRLGGASCRPQPGLLEQVGNALSGTASAVRAPGP